MAAILCGLTLSGDGVVAQTLPAGFVDAGAVVPGLAVDMRYAGPDNFVGSRIDGYEAPRCWLTEEAGAALAAAQAELKAAGLGLKVFDCYRPARAVAHFVRWARAPGESAGKARYHPDIPKRDLFRRGYIGARSGHSRGSTVDLTLVSVPDGVEAAMGTPFDFFGPASGRGASGIGASERANRERLRAVMGRHGFAPYDREWWHFGLKREPFPTTYLDVPIR